MEQVFKEDAMMVARNILSGKNACGTLQRAVDNSDAGYFAAAADAVLRVKREEVDHARRQRDTVLKEAEKYRFALEVVVQNLVPARSPPTGDMLLPRNDNVRSILEKALGRSFSWDSG